MIVIHTSLRFAALILVAIGIVGPALAQQALLPGGASALNEAHGSWTVACSVVDAAKSCAFSQAVANGQTGQVLVALDLGAPSEGRAEGMLLTAFGLRLDAGVEIAVDGSPVGGPLPFFICIETGCLVPLQLDEVTLSALGVGTELTVTGINGQTGEAVTIPLSLDGFTEAYRRTIALSL